MNKFHIKKISEVDKKKLLKFYQSSFNLKKIDLDSLNWRYRYGFKQYEPLVLEIDNDICGHAGLITNDLKIKNEIKTGIWFTDFYINKKYRSLGYGKLLTQAWMKICPIQVTLCNDASLKIFKKLDWSSNNKFLRKLEIFNYLNLIPIFKNNNIPNVIKENLKIKEINNQIVSNIANESEKLLSQKSFGVVRDENWFKWRVLECPYKKNMLIFNYEGVDIITNLKVKYNFKILNIIYISRPINLNLTKVFSSFIRKNKINFISYISKNEKFLNVSLPWSKKLNFAFNSSDSTIKDSINENFNDLQFIDSDIDFI